MIAFPSIFEDLNADLFEDILLICVFVSGGDEESLLIRLELIVRPEGIIESKITMFAVIRIISVK